MSQNYGKGRQVNGNSEYIFSAPQGDGHGSQFATSIVMLAIINAEKWCSQPGNILMPVENRRQNVFVFEMGFLHATDVY